MPRRLAIALLALCLACLATPVLAAPPELPAVVDAVEVTGLWRTQEFVVLRELPWKPGERVAPEAWDLGVQRLWNTSLFSRVEARLERREDGRRVAVVAVEERWTVQIIFRYGIGGGAAWMRAGLADINTFGRFVETGALYERFGPYNGGQAWLRLPRLLDGRRELLVLVDRLVRPRPGFSVVRTGIHLENTHQLDDTLATGGRLDLVDDEFLAPLEGPELRPEASRTLLATHILRIGRIDQRRLLATGWLLDLRPALGLTTAPEGLAFVQGFAELQAFLIAAPWLNLGLRFQLAAQSDVQPQHRFHLGGLDTIRGFKDNHLRTQAFGLLNLEARALVFDSTWFAVMPAVFLDAAAIAPEPEMPAGALSAGFGVRFLIPRFYHSGMRVDLAFPATIGGAPQLSVGVWQFFGP